jgi:prepilin-type N-terminal cleavage/methylation domain-containing protein
MQDYRLQMTDSGCETGFLRRVVQHQPGFTLLEILIVIAAIGMLSAVAIPTYSQQLPKYRLNGAARHVMADLFVARQRAVSQMHNVRVLFAAEHAYTLWTDRNDNGAIDSDETTTQALRTYGVTLSANNNPTFYPNGVVTHLPTIVLRHISNPTQLKKCMSISITGRIKISECQE